MILLVYERAHRELESHCSEGKQAMTWLFGTFTCYFLSMCIEALVLRESLKAWGGGRGEVVAHTK